MHQYVLVVCISSSCDLMVPHVLIGSLVSRLVIHNLPSIYRLDHGEKLHRSIYALILTSIYASIAIFAWATRCVLVHRPLGGPSYVELMTHRDSRLTVNEKLMDC